MGQHGEHCFLTHGHEDDVPLVAPDIDLDQRALSKLPGSAMTQGEHRDRYC
jgi:hypothetical protein